MQWSPALPMEIALEGAEDGKLDAGDWARLHSKIIFRGPFMLPTMSTRVPSQ